MGRNQNMSKPTFSYASSIPVTFSRIRARRASAPDMAALMPAAFASPVPKPMILRPRTLSSTGLATVSSNIGTRSGSRCAKAVRTRSFRFMAAP